MLLHLLSADSPSLWDELKDYFVNQYFTIDYGNYDNIHLSNPLFTARSLIICLFIGVLIASIMAIFQKRVLGDFVRAISRENATSPDRAQTLETLGFLKNSAVRSALKRNGSLRRAVRCVEDDRADLAIGTPMHKDIADLYPEIIPGAPDKARRASHTRTDLDHAHFFIPESQIYTAEIRYEKKGTNWLGFFAAILLCLIVVILLFKVMPDLLQMLDNFINMVKPEPKILS